MDGHPGRERCEVAGEAMSPRDLERDDSHLDGSARRRERTLDPPDVQDEDLLCAELHRPRDRDAVHDAPVHEVLAADLDRRQDAGHGRRCEDRVDERSLEEPVFGRLLDRSGDALERDGEVFETRGGE